MIKAVFLDLDNTLLKNPDHAFAVEYLRLVDDYFSEHWQYTGMSRPVLNSLRAMADTRDGQQTNTELALSILSQSTSRSAAELREAFTSFYKGRYAALRQCSEPVPMAADLVHWLLEQKYAVVIATNPIYPAEAIGQRLAWAGLPDQIGTYTLVTHSDNMHFTKATPAYYAEILGKVGIEPDEAIMVGDSLERDILPARQIGLHTFQIHESLEQPPEESAGTITDFFQRVSEQDWLTTLSPHALKPEMIEPQLLGNIGALFGMLMDVKDHFWHQHPDPDEWSIMQIVCHLRDSETGTQRPRLQRILAEDNPFLVNPKPPPGPAEYPCDEDGLQVAHQFANARHETIRFLRTLTPADWQRPARHSIFGMTTLLEMAHFTAQHDRLHLNQLCQTLGNCE